MQYIAYILHCMCNTHDESTHEPCPGSSLLLKLIIQRPTKIANCLTPPGPQEITTKPPTYWSRSPGGAKFSGSAGATSAVTSSFSGHAMENHSKWHSQFPPLHVRTVKRFRGHRKICPGLVLRLNIYDCWKLAVRFRRRRNEELDPND